MLTLEITWPQESYKQIGKHKTRNSSFKNPVLLLGGTIPIQILR